MATEKGKLALGRCAYSQKFGGANVSTSIERYVENVLRQIDGSKKEKEDLYAELTDHLYLSHEHWMEAGLTEEEAKKKALGDFGNSEAIGSEIQEAMYPFRKIMLLVLAIVSLLFSYAVYIFSLFVEGDAHMLWLVLAVGTSSLLLMIALQVFPTIDRKVVVNFALVIHGLVFLAGTGFSTVFSIIAWGVVAATIGLIYRTTIVDYEFTVTKYKKQLTICHIYNITIGLIVVGMTLFFGWSFLAFSNEFVASMLLFFVPLLIWLVTYYFQITLINKGNVVVAIFLGILPFAIVAVIIFVIFFDGFVNEVAL